MAAAIRNCLSLRWGISVSNRSLKPAFSSTHPLSMDTLTCSSYFAATPNSLITLKWSPYPELHRAGFHTKEVHRSKCFGGEEIGIPDRLRSGDLLHERQACCLDYTTGTEISAK